MRLPLDGSKTTALETADYIALLARELRGLAAKADLAFLAYLLAMVEDDAHATIRRLNEQLPPKA
jgi:hypothetical protein